MFNKSLFFLIVAVLVSCKPTGSDVRNKVVEMNSPVVEKSNVTPRHTLPYHPPIVTLDLQSAIDQICRSIYEIEGFTDFESYGGELVGNDGYSISYGFIDDMYIVVLKKLSHRTSDGRAYYIVLDIDSVKNSTDNRQVHHTYFKFKENANNEFMSGFVTVTNDTCDQILKSWTIDFKNNKFIELDTDGIELTNNWFGYDG